ncbi:hypothetical protein [Streptomyces sp. NPDC006739]|uniref:hypothetical protein n=1 Tax=Streptomyces sp. NPDC006739 TaxID=3364763 RepID=UPI003698C729
MTYAPPQDLVYFAGPGGFLHRPPGKSTDVWTPYAGGPDIPVPGVHRSYPGASGAGSDVVATVTSTGIQLHDMDTGTTTTMARPSGHVYVGAFGSRVLTSSKAADGTASLHVLDMVNGQLTDTPVSGWPVTSTGTPPVTAGVMAGDANSVVVKYNDGTGYRLGLVDLATAQVTPVFGTVPATSDVVMTDKYVGWYLEGDTRLHLLSRSDLTGSEATVQIPLTTSPSSKTYQMDVRRLAIVGDTLLIIYNWANYPDPTDYELGAPLYAMPLTGGTPSPVIDHVQIDTLAPAPNGAVALGGSSLADWGVRQVTPGSGGDLAQAAVYPDPGGPAPIGGMSLADGQLTTIENGGEPGGNVFTRTIRLGSTPSYGPHTAFGTALEPSDCTSATYCAPQIDTGDGRISQLVAGNKVSVQSASNGYSEVTPDGAGGTLVDSDGRYVVYDSSSTGKQSIGDTTLSSASKVLFTRPVSAAALSESTLWVANPTPAGSISAIELTSQKTTRTLNTGAPCAPSELQAAAGRWIYWSCGTSGPAGVYDLTTNTDVSVPSSGPAQLGDGFVVEHDTSAGKLELTDVHTGTAVTSELADLPTGPLTDDRRVTWAVDKYSGGGIAYLDAHNDIHIVDPHIPASTASGHLMLPGQRLNPGQSITSSSMRLVMQTDGNLVAYLRAGGSGSPAEWSSGTYGHPGAYAVMQSDGNLVVYDQSVGLGTGGALWSTHSSGHPGAYADLEDDGNLVVYRQATTDSADALWSSGSYARPQTIRSGQALTPGWWTQGQRTWLVMRPDGNLVMYRKRDGAAIWSTRTSGHSGAYAIMQSEGNLVLYRKSGGPSTGGALWSSGTYGHPGAYAIMQDDGNLVVYKSGGGPGVGGALWATNTGRSAS